MPPTPRSSACYCRSSARSASMSAPPPPGTLSFSFCSSSSQRRHARQCPCRPLSSALQANRERSDQLEMDNAIPSPPVLDIFMVHIGVHVEQRTHVTCLRSRLEISQVCRMRFSSVVYPTFGKTNLVPAMLLDIQGN
ncbi:hypothetical protein U9M48_008740 [Paspalum notatum var. saurae]|uniref:Uncharacterized protein n=1 Tax=Paspalum notatum var. saurae TaxID=547442 RepID=A0AAQ3WE27_PASNO